MNCIFCDIINKKINSKIFYENDNVIVIDDINKVAPIHKLVISKKHYKNIIEADELTILDIFKAIKFIVNENLIYESGFRIVSNCNKNGCQEIFHLHVHIIGGKLLGPKIG